MLSAVAGQIGTGILVVISQLAAGWMAAFGGLRTEEGRHAMYQILGLRRYLRTVDKATLQRICGNDPEYFHTLMPYALALDSGKAFAKRFGNMRIPQCPYLISDAEKPQTADHWCALMRHIINSMNARRKQLGGEKLLGFFQGLTK